MNYKGFREGSLRTQTKQLGLSMSKDVSRQAIWQRVQRARGRCVQCGMRSMRGGLCAYCISNVLKKRKREDPVPCFQCGARGFSKHGLRIHLSRVHGLKWASYLELKHNEMGRAPSRPLVIQPEETRAEWRTRQAL